MQPAEIVDRDVRYHGWLTLSILSVRMKDGRVTTREVVEHGQSASVLPYDPERRCAVVIRQLRAPVLWKTGETSLLEAIAGMVDAESTDAAARREAWEEAGLRLADVEPISNVWTSPGMLSERQQLFLAAYREADRVGAGGGLVHEHEDIEVLEMPLADLAGLVDTGKVYDMKLLALVQTLRVRRPDLFRS